MFKKIASSDISAEEVKNRILAYTSLQAAKEVQDQQVWSGNIEIYTMYLRLSGIFNEQKFVDVLASNDDHKFNSSKYVYLPNQAFLQETVHLDHTTFVQEMYRSFLRREADPGGLAGNVEQLNNGAPRENLVIGIRKSGEADNVFLRVTDCLDDHTFLEITQTVYLTGELTSEQTQEMLAALEQGKSRSEVFVALKQLQALKLVLETLKDDFDQPDEEFLSKTSDLSDEEFVKQLYLTFLKREADPGGLAGNVEQLSNGVARQKILYALRTSGEAANVFVNLTSGVDDRAFLDLACRAYWKRELNPEEQKIKLQELSQDKSRQEIITQISN